MEESYCLTCNERNNCKGICSKVEKMLQREIGPLIEKPKTDKYGEPILYNSGPDLFVRREFTIYKRDKQIKRGSNIYQRKFFHADIYGPENAPADWQEYSMECLSEIQNKIRFYREVKQLDYKHIAIKVKRTKSACRDIYREARQKLGEYEEIKITNDPDGEDKWEQIMADIEGLNRDESDIP